MKKLALILLIIPTLVFSQYRGSGGLTNAQIEAIVRAIVADSNVVKILNDSLIVQGNKAAKFSGLRVTGNSRFDGTSQFNNAVTLNSTIGSAITILGTGGSTVPLTVLGNKTTGDLADFINDKNGAVGDTTTRITNLGQIRIRNSAIGSTADTLYGIKLQNLTYAAAGAQQVSPGVMFSSYGWKTDATASPVWTQWMIYNLPVQGTSAPSSTLFFDSKTGSGSWNRPFYVTSGGVASIGSGSGQILLRYLACPSNSFEMSSEDSYYFDIDYNNDDADTRFFEWGKNAGGSSHTPLMRLTEAGKLGLGTTTPLNSFSLVDATSGQGTGIHVVSSQWNKSRTTWAAAHDTSSIMQYIDSAGGPRLSFSAVDADTFALHVTGSVTNLVSKNYYAIHAGTTLAMNIGITGGTIDLNRNTIPYSTDTFSLGTTGQRWQNYWGSDNIYLGGKSQTATIYISGENTIAGQDSSLVLSALNGVPTISAMHIGTFTNGGRRFYTGSDTLLLVNGAKTGRDSTLYVTPAGSVYATGAFYTNSTSVFSSAGVQCSNNDVVTFGNSSTGSNSALKLTTKNVEAIRIDNSQNVGIGVTVPGAKAEINGNKSADTLMIVRNDRIGAPYDSVFTILNNGNMGSNGVVTIKRSVQLADAGEYTPQIPAGMCGWGTVQCGNEQEFARFRFKADGTVTLEANSTNVGTTNDTDTKMNIYDAGTSGIVIENQLGSTLKFAVVIECYVP